MKPILITAIALSMTAVTGCAPNYAEVKPDRYQNAVKVQDSEFDSKVSFQGPKLRSTHSAGLLSMYHNAFLLRGWRSKATGKTIGHQLYVEIRYSAGGAAHFRSASFEGGKQASLKVIHLDVTSCTVECVYQEIVGVSVSDAFLREQSDTGFKVRLNAKSGAESIIEVPANYIQGYLVAVLSQ